MLRKTTTILALTLFLALPASAQLIPGVSGIGIKGGGTFSTLRGDFPGGDADSDFDTGFVGGLYGEASFLPFFTPRIEALYAQKGSSFRSGGDEFTYDLDVIEIPLLFELNLPIAERIFPGLYAGPFVSFAVDQELDSDAQALLANEDDDLFETTDYGIVLGTDVDFSFAGKSVTLSGRYDLGLRNVISDDNLNATNGEEIDLKTSTIMVSLGFSI